MDLFDYYYMAVVEYEIKSCAKLEFYLHCMIIFQKLQSSLYRCMLCLSCRKCIVSVSCDRFVLFGPT